MIPILAFTERVRSVIASTGEAEVPLCLWLSRTTVFAKRFPPMMNRATIPLPSIAASAIDGFATSTPRMKNGIGASWSRETRAARHSYGLD